MVNILALVVTLAAAISGACCSRSTKTLAVPAAAREGVKSISEDDARGIARKDAEQNYGRLDNYGVSARLENNGWHVEYHLKPELNGGGPEYLIDAHTGAILTKRYYQ